MFFNPHLRHPRDEVTKTRLVMGGQAVTNDDDQIEIGICLRAQTGQGDRFKQAKALFKAGLAVEKGDALLDAVVLYLKAADGRIGKSTKPDDLHH